MLSLLGTLPISAINLGLVAALPALTDQAAKLTAELALFPPTIAAQLGFHAALPSPDDIALAVAGSVNPAAIAALLNPQTWVTANVTANVELAVKLGLVQVRLALVETIAATLSAGLAAPGIAGWSYTGSARGFGVAMEAATPLGAGSLWASDSVAGAVIATHSAGSWDAFREGFRTGEPIGLQYLGQWGGAKWNTGVRRILARINLYLGELRGLRASLLAQIQAAVGLRLPNPEALLSVSLDLPSIVLGTALTLNLTAAVAQLQAKLDLVLELMADLQAQLSAGGLSVWSYSGRLGDLGAELAAETAGGLPGVGEPGRTAYGLALVAAPGNWSMFGGVFVGG